MIGEGSYAQVFKYRDDEYRMHVAVKKARNTLDTQELMRFKAEYDVLRDLNFPYILKVYGYDHSGPSYSMEYCDFTLLKYISENNTKLNFGVRKRIAQQFLYGINHLSVKEILHRDLSFTNVLVQQFDAGTVQVKLSDFGLHKRPNSILTRTGTLMKGTIIDPTLSHFREYSLTNEIHAVGHILSFIFTGRESLELGANALGHIITKCVDHDVQKRYTAIPEIIGDVSVLTTS
nr:protein kinase family protein [Paeniglutamicibacter psychrophenolicus]